MVRTGRIAIARGSGTESVSLEPGDIDSEEGLSYSV
jgi:hypothetical protein